MRKLGNATAVEQLVFVDPAREQVGREVFNLSEGVTAVVEVVHSVEARATFSRKSERQLSDDQVSESDNVRVGKCALL